MKIRIDPLTGMPIVVNEEVRIYSQSGGGHGSGGGGGSVNSVTATNGTIIVDNSDSANPKVAVGTGIPEASVANLVSDLAAKEAIVNKGIANGYASLDSSGLVPLSQLPLLTASTQRTFVTAMGF